MDNWITSAITRARVEIATKKIVAPPLRLSRAMGQDRRVDLFYKTTGKTFDEINEVLNEARNQQMLVTSPIEGFWPTNNKETPGKDILYEIDVNTLRSGIYFKIWGYRWIVSYRIPDTEKVHFLQIELGLTGDDPVLVTNSASEVERSIRNWLKDIYVKHFEK